MTYRILFVCLGNICRSPSAEGIMRHLIRQHQLDGQVICDSAGTSSYHIGSPPDRRMRAAAQRQGIELKGEARQFIPANFDRFDLILVMDRENYSDVMALTRSPADVDKVRLMCEFCQHHADTEVPDPYYGGTDGFDYVIRLLLDACEGALAHAQEQMANSTTG